MPYALVTALCVPEIGPTLPNSGQRAAKCAVVRICAGPDQGAVFEGNRAVATWRRTAVTRYLTVRRYPHRSAPRSRR
jgi:hypothetical protein